MELGIAGRTAIVCGASQGMGRAIAEGLVREGVNLVVCARDESNLQTTARELITVCGREAVVAVAADLALPDSAKRVVDRALQTWGRLDILVNNIGGPPPGQPSRFSDHDWRGAFEKNFFNVVRLCREALPHMRRQRWGRVVNLLAISVLQVEDNLALSSTARSAVVAYAKSLSDEVAADGVTVNNLLPGSVLTGRLEAVSRMQAEFHGKDPEQALAERLRRIPAGRFGEPREIADLVCFLASERAGFITGVSIPFDGGQLRAM